MGRKPLELSGKRFGRLTVLGYSHNYNGFTYWNCLCDCGNETVVRGVRLTHGKTKSCGCLLSAITAAQNRERADGHYRDERLYRIYYGIKTRCYNSKEAGYERYGGRGISMCDEWKDDFLKFQEWALSAGYRPDLTIDRVDNDGDYSPENCRWANVKQQSNNRRSNVMLNYGGTQRTVAEWSEIVGIGKNTIYQRLRDGWSAEDALSIPVGKYRGGRDVHRPFSAGGV